MRVALLLAASMSLVAAGSAGAAGLRQVATIPILGKPLKSIGAIVVDAASHRAFLADRSNKGIDVLDTRSNTFVKNIHGFVGVGPTGATSGPQGVAVIDEGREVWAADGDSTVKVINVAAGAITAVISTGGKKRTGELAYDPRDQVMLVTNPDEPTQFVTLISTRPDHRIIAKILLPEAVAEGIERSLYSPQTGKFYVPVPSLDAAKSAGGIAEIDPRQGKLVRIRDTNHCNPHSLAIVSKTRLLIGCDFGPADAQGPKGQLALFDLTRNQIVATGPGLGGDGQSAIDPRLGVYYAAANKNPGGPALRVVDARTLRAIQMAPSWNGSHSVAVDTTTHHVFLPAAAGAAPCGGCVVVYAPH